MRGPGWGGEGSPCALPVSFALVEGWEPDATDAATATPDPKVTSSLVCEISGRAAGTPALLRVWTNGTGERNPRRALEVFVDGFHGEPARVAYSEIEAGQFTGAEVVFAEGYRTEKPKVEMTRAFAVSTGKGVAVVHLWGNAADEAGLLRAYELAKRTVRPSG